MSTALVVDDLPEDRLAIADALSTAGMNVIVSSGERIGTPREVGVRVVVLDLHLQAAPMSDANIVANAIAVLTNQIPPDNGPYVLLLWTTREDLLPSLRKAVEGLSQPPVAVTSLEKASAKATYGPGYDADVIVDRVANELSPQAAVRLMMGWESLVEQAARLTTSALLRDGDNAASILANLIKASAPSLEWPRADSLIPALLQALTPLLQDQLLHMNASGHGVTEAAIAIAVDPTPKLKQSALADLNGRLHVAAPGSSARPGQMYRLDAIRRSVSGGCPTRATLIAEMFADVDQASEDVTAVLLEVTPACDYFQGNLTTARLLTGLLVPASEAKYVKGSPAFNRLPVLGMAKAGLDGEWVTILNARHWVGVNKRVLDSAMPMCRLRDEMMTEIRAWATAQANRVGILSMR